MVDLPREEMGLPSQPNSLAGRGHEGLKLGYLLTDLGFFHRGHRAVDDCHALLRLLASPLRSSGQLAMSALLATARRPTVRLWAEDSPFETKEVLKARSYRWSQRRRNWYADLDVAQIEIERTFLSEKVIGRPVPNLPSDKFAANDRFSARANPEL
ncbi:hypothetical protein [Methylobacterium sp. J-077]|uniref:hypothetical protein n=1 Tax=Methylobacterium sp. J-077 TaxID=2836656 RepID=UPI001FB9B373|nr:hypothetical protein [Methylobacterium sp. J-077]MCJ2122400.1 hypothetical protein [Methylobacterium sp. J-077]